MSDLKLCFATAIPNFKSLKITWICPNVYQFHRIEKLVVANKITEVSIVIIRALGVNPYSAGIDFSRQNLTSADVRFWRLKSIPAL